MKMRLTAVALLTAILFLCTAAHGATDDLLDGMGKKFFRGAVNVLTGWVEFPMQVVKGYNNEKFGENKLLGVGSGILKGIGHSVGRTAWGVVELVGFWTANHEDNNGIGLPLDSEYAWEQGEPYDCCDPDFTEAALRPMVRKLMRGVGNGVFGFAELPGQIAKGIHNKAWDLGIIKGFWFWYSREVYGIGEIATAIFPNPKDNPGYRFDEEYPWDAIVTEIEE